VLAALEALEAIDEAGLKTGARSSSSHGVTRKAVDSRPARWAPPYSAAHAHSSDFVDIKDNDGNVLGDRARRDAGGDT
jgi:hypothetical protein